MSTPTYQLIDSVTLGFSATSVSFTGIDQSYRDLVVVVTAKSSVDFRQAYMKLNNSSITYYNNFFGTGPGDKGASAGSDTAVRLGSSYNPVTISGTFSVVANIMDYSQTNKNKQILTRAGTRDGASAGVDMAVTTWPSTAAVSSLYFTLNSGNYSGGSTFFLYGIAG